MPQESVIIDGDLRKRLIRRANESNLSFDEYLALLDARSSKPPTNGNGESHEASPVESRGSRMRERLEEMQDFYMMRSMSMGQAPPGLMADAASPAIERLADRLERIEKDLNARAATPPADDMGMDGIIRSVIKYRAMAPLLNSLDGTNGANAASSANREIEKELRGAVDRVRDQMLLELRAKDTQISQIQQAASEARIADMKGMVDSLRDEISTLSTRLENGPPAQQGNVAQQLTEALQQASAVQGALDQIAKRGQPPAPSTGPQSTVETIAYLANELSGAVSKGLEAVARVNAANRGHNPDALGRMPPPGTPAPTYRPAYVDTPPQRPPPRQPPARRPAPATEAPAVGRGMGMVFEGAPPRKPPAAPPPAAVVAPEEPQVSGPQLDVSQLQPLDPRIQQFQGPEGQQYTREQFQALREAVYLRTGRDPLEVRDVDAPPPTDAGAPPAPEAPPEGGEGGEFIDGTSDENPS